MQVSFRKETFHVDVKSNETLLQLKELIQDLTNIPSGNQKLMFKKKGKEFTNLVKSTIKITSDATRDDDDGTLQEIGLRDGTKIMVIGSTNEQIEQMKAIKVEGTFDSK